MPLLPWDNEGGGLAPPDPRERMRLKVRGIKCAGHGLPALLISTHKVTHALFGSSCSKSPPTVQRDSKQSDMMLLAKWIGAEILLVPRCGPMCVPRFCARVGGALVHAPFQDHTGRVPAR